MCLVSRLECDTPTRQDRKKRKKKIGNKKPNIKVFPNWKIERKNNKK